MSEPGTEGLELFHLGRDLGEKENQAASEPDRVASLQAAFAAWDQGNVPAIFPGFRRYIKEREAFHQAVKAGESSRGEP